jgi:hypothetical protein
MMIFVYTGRKLEEEKVSMSQCYQELEQKSTPEIVDEDIDRQAVM